MENETVDATPLDGVFSRRLGQKGLTVLGEYSDLKKPMINQSAMVSSTLLQQRPEIAENFLKAMIENIAFSFDPKNKAIVIKTIMRRLKADQNSAEEGYRGPAARHRTKALSVRRGIAQRAAPDENAYAKSVRLGLEPLIEAGIMRKLDESGFIDRVYAAHGIKP